MRKVEREYYDKELLMHKNNLRKSWEIIKDVINKKKKVDLPDKFNIEDVMVTDKLEIAFNLKKNYVNIGKNLSNDIPTNSGDPLSYIKTQVPDSIFLESVDESEIISICKNMKDCSSGWDQTIPRVVKSTYQNFIVPITHVMNLSIINGVVPNELKVAKVVPIYKSGDRRLINNYRPVSVLPCFSKILDKLMYNRIYNFIHKHNLLNEYKFGFRQKRSTNQALIVLLDKITAALDNGAIVLGVFLDFSKAFDTVDHQILLNTQFMVFSLMKHIITNTDLFINNQIIYRVEHTMFLGVILDSHLTWSYHIQHVKIKIAKNIGILCRARKVLKRTTLITLYYAFIYPYLTYCVEDSDSDLFYFVSIQHTVTVMYIKK